MRLLLLLAIVGGCHNPRPVVCQRFKQCCTAATASGADTETIRSTCMRKDDSDETTCRRNLESIRAAIPSLADNDECNVP